MRLTFSQIKSLDQSYGPVVIKYLYWASLVITIGSGFVDMISEGFTFLSFIRGLFIIFFGGVMCRLIAELALVLFKIEQHLRPVETPSIEPDSDEGIPDEVS